MLLKIKKAIIAAGKFIASGFRFYRAALCEPSGKPSSSKCATLLLLIAYIVVVIKARGIPDHTDQFAILILALHGTNQLRAGLQKFAELRANAAPPTDSPAGPGNPAAG